MDEKKPERLKDYYKIVLPPREVPVEFDVGEGKDPLRFVLRRPSIGERNKLMKEMGALKLTPGTDIDAENWIRVIKAVVVPVMAEQAIRDLDSYISDKLFQIGQQVLFESSLSEEQKKE